MLQERYEIEQLANEEMVNENPDFLGYALKDHSKHPFPNSRYRPRPHAGGPPARFRMPPGIGKTNANNDQYVRPTIVGGDYLDSMSNSQLQSMLDRLKKDNSPSKFNPLSYLQPSNSEEKSQGLLSKFLPKVSFGFTSKQKNGQNPVFGDDPFFSDFKRSMNQGKKNSVEEDAQFNAIVKQRLITRISRKIKENDFVQRKKKELAQVHNTTAFVSFDNAHIYCHLLTIADNRPSGDVQIGIRGRTRNSKCSSMSNAFQRMPI